MPRQMDTGDEWEDDAEGDDSTIECPYCRKEIHEDSERCPHCESYISREDMPASHKPWWIILGALAGLFVVYKWIAGW